MLKLKTIVSFLRSVDLIRHFYCEPAHDKIYNTTFVTYSKSGERDFLPYWVAVQTDLSLCWPQMSYCWFSRALALVT